MAKWIVGIICLIIIGGGVYYATQASSRPLPGESVADLGRDHVPQSEWSTFSYNSNPPTSGPHDVQWTQSGIYDVPQGEGYLIHSLEHGYVIISYNCTKLNSKLSRQAAGQNSKLLWIGRVYADHPDDDGNSAPHASSSAESTSGGQLNGDVWNSKECISLKQQLKVIAEEKRLWKLIVIPRPNMDSVIALTAWTRIQKLDTPDKAKIYFFIDMFRDHGPEKTME